MSPSENTAAPVIDRHRLIYRWDLDKTYLRTEFDTFRDLVSRAFERAKDKHTVPGASALLREIRSTEPHGLYILSGSPEQMRRVLEAKLRLDGIRWDGFTLKPSLRNLLHGHFGFLRDQVGFKLGALLGAREALPATFDEILFGDDAEADAYVYSLYADVCSGLVGIDVLRRVLAQTATTPEDLERLLLLAGRLTRRDHCQRIFIHLDRISSVDRFAVYGPRVCPFYNYFQASTVLLEMGAIDARAVLRVAADLVIDQAFSPEALLASFLELSRRGQIGAIAQRELVAALTAAQATEFATATPALVAFGADLARTTLPEPTAPVALPPIDYPTLLKRERARAKAAKKRAIQRI